MNLVRWDPFRELEDMSHRLNRLLAGKDVKRQDGNDTMIMADWVPTVDISETDQEFQIQAELPGVKKEDIKVSVDGNQVSISAEVKKEKEEKEGKKVIRSERYYGSVSPSFTLSSPAFSPRP